MDKSIMKNKIHKKIITDAFFILVIFSFIVADLFLALYQAEVTNV
jgi:hypothetical protein